MRRAVTFLLSSTIGFSACAGGIFGVPMGLAAQVEEPGPTNETLASPVWNLSTCVDLSPDIGEVRDEAEDEQAQTGGCGESGECLSVITSIVPLDATAHDSNENHAIPTSAQTQSASPQKDDASVAARDGPLFHDASNHRHTLAKKE